MKLIFFRHQGVERYGSLEGDQVRDLGTGSFADACEIARGAPGLRPLIALDAVTLLPPVAGPGKIICVGVNYADHRAEMGRTEVAHPTLFTRFADTQVGHGAPLIRPRVSERLDYEGELAVVIGKAGRRITEADALGHVAGYACYNDATVRDWQNHSSQFTPGKNFPGTGGFGPWLVTADEIPDPHALTLTTRLNGEVVQQASTGDMIFRIPQIIAYISAFTPLAPGDVISTGTPAGVGARRSPPLWLKSGDTVEVEISGIGTLRNTVADEV